jgi:large subunit ribosomal protein L16
MATMPKRVKFRKYQRGRVKGRATRGHVLAFGDYGLQALEPGWISARQIEAGRVAATRFMSQLGKLWIRVFPRKSVTARPPETRMGKGKAEPEFWVDVVRPGKIVYEVGGVPDALAREAMLRIAHKLPFRTKLVKRGG